MSVQKEEIAMSSIKWDFSTVADRLGDVLNSAESDLRLEQAVYGLDAKDERELQSVLAAGLLRFYEVAREVHYPSTEGRKLTHRARCDLVLTPKGRPLAPAKLAEPNLFTMAGGPDTIEYCSPADALWLEVKVACQFREGGARHSGYGVQWRQKVIADLRKMEAEPLIHEAGLVLLVFNESPEILAKDLELFEDVLALKEVLAGFRKVRSIPILDRIGHRLCTAAVWPTVQR
jgi:hypothetical protein